MVKPRSASKNARRNDSSDTTAKWFVATVAIVSVSRLAYSASSLPMSTGGDASTCCAAMPKPRHIPSRPETTAAASAAASLAASSSAPTPAAANAA